MNLNVLKKQTGNHRFPSYELFFHQSKFEFVFFAILNQVHKFHQKMKLKAKLIY